LVTVDFLNSTAVGNIESFVGDIIAVVGFGLTLFGVYKATSAAEAARTAAASVKQELSKNDQISACTLVISIMEVIKRDQRDDPPRIEQLIDRYGELRRLMVQLKESDAISRQNDALLIGEMLTECRQMETDLEISLKTNSSLDTPKLNEAISRMLDEFNGILARLRAQG